MLTHWAVKVNVDKLILVLMQDWKRKKKKSIEGSG